MLKHSLLVPAAEGQFLEIIESLQPEGQTPLGEALLASVDMITEQYKKQLGYTGTYRIIIITDGEQTGIDLKQPAIATTSPSMDS